MRFFRVSWALFALSTQEHISSKDGPGLPLNSACWRAYSALPRSRRWRLVSPYMALMAEGFEVGEMIVAPPFVAAPEPRLDVIDF